MDIEKLEGKSGIATYAEIKAYIEEKYGFKVPTPYIAQTKDKVGIKERKNYNVGTGKGKIQICPPEKENGEINKQEFYKNWLNDGRYLYEHSRIEGNRQSCV